LTSPAAAQTEERALRTSTRTRMASAALTSNEANSRFPRPPRGARVQQDEASDGGQVGPSCTSPDRARTLQRTAREETARTPRAGGLGPGPIGGRRANRGTKRLHSFSTRDSLSPRLSLTDSKAIPAPFSLLPRSAAACTPERHARRKKGRAGSVGAMPPLRAQGSRDRERRDEGREEPDGAQDRGRAKSEKKREQIEMSGQREKRKRSTGQKRRTRPDGARKERRKRRTEKMQSEDENGILEPNDSIEQPKRRRKEQSGVRREKKDRKESRTDQREREKKRKGQADGKEESRKKARTESGSRCEPGACEGP